jgi:hypothetical protein
MISIRYRKIKREKQWWESVPLGVLREFAVEQARQEVAQLGLNLEYSQRWTKGDWDNAVEEVKVKGRELIDDV